MKSIKVSIGGFVWGIKCCCRNYKLCHLRLGKVKNLNKNNHMDFKIEKISWDIHWQTELYLTVIIRDYLRSFIKHTPAIGNCVIKDKSLLYRAADDDWKNWETLVNSVADEFDELIRHIQKLEETVDENEHDLRVEKVELTKKAFADLAYIYDDLWW